MRELTDIRRFWQNNEGEELALCTLISKKGSAYRSTGAKKIIKRRGGACGLMSGGCLEAEIESTLRKEWDSLPFVRSFNTTGPEDKLLGYQMGCAGVIDLLCERLPATLELIDLYIPFGTSLQAADVVVSLAPASLGKRSVAPSAVDAPFYVDQRQYPIRLGVIGCGIDAVPFVELAQPLGWELEFFDYRDSLRANFPKDALVTIMPLREIAGHLKTGTKSAVLLMTHNYNADLSLLNELSVQHARGKKVGYIGALGPRARFDQICAELATPLCSDMQKIIHAPPGLFGDTHAPKSIALSIVADIASRLGMP